MSSMTETFIFTAMKKIIYALTYLAALVIGVCLLVFNQQVVEDAQPVLRPVMIAAGVIFVIPGIYFLLSSLRTQRDANGLPVSRPWFSTVVGAISLIWGILLLCMPDGLLGNINISFGVSLIVASIAEIIWIVRGRRVNGAPIWLYILPLITIAAGVYVLLMKADYQNPGNERIWGCIVTGAALILWSINGFMSLPRRKKTPADIEKEARKLAKQQEKAVKDQAKEAKARLEEAKAGSEEARRHEEEAKGAAEEAEKKLRTVSGEQPVIKTEETAEKPEEKAVSSADIKDTSTTKPEEDSKEK